MRKEKIQCTFNKIINSGKEGVFVVFTNSDTGKVVQFTYDSEEKLFVCDIPLDELTKEEEKMIRKTFVYPLLEKGIQFKIRTYF